MSFLSRIAARGLVARLQACGVSPAVSYCLAYAQYPKGGLDPGYTPKIAPKQVQDIVEPLLLAPTAARIRLALADIYGAEAAAEIEESSPDVDTLAEYRRGL
jgi:hypothetical protein